MSSHAESLTQKWLRHNVQPYPHKDTVSNDISSAISQFTTLRPKSDVYTYDDGRTQLLLCVHGLLPISFRAASYNIPIAIWLTREYPREPPISYVVPTNDMLVKANKYVDVSGRCHIDYLQHWARKSEGCNLPTLLGELQNQFSKEPPVYAKPSDLPATQSRPQHTVNDPRSRPPPLLPMQRSPSARPTTDRPDIPLRPTSTPYSTAHTQSAQSLQPVPSTHASPSGSGSEPPLPPRPPLETLPPQYRIPYTAPPVPPSYAIPTGHGINPTSTLYPSQHNLQAPISNSVGPVPVALPGGPPPPPPPRPPNISPEVPVSSPYSHQSVAFHQSPTEAVSQSYRAPVLNLLDEDSPETQIAGVAPVFAPPPPRPPNPELLRLHDQVHHKLTTELSSLSHALGLDAERLRAQQTDLLAGEPAIRDEMARLEAVRDVCRNVAGRLKSSVQQAETNIAELRRKGDPEIDELICSTTIVHNQLISLVAEDNAIEDTIYHLHRALNSGRIDLERFLRSARLLAEEQFMKRALIEKIQEGIPIGMSMGSEWS